MNDAGERDRAAPDGCLRADCSGPWKRRSVVPQFCGIAAAIALIADLFCCAPASAAPATPSGITVRLPAANHPLSGRVIVTLETAAPVHDFVDQIPRVVLGSDVVDAAPSRRFAYRPTPQQMRARCVPSHRAGIK